MDKKNCKSSSLLAAGLSIGDLSVTGEPTCPYRPSRRGWTQATYEMIFPASHLLAKLDQIGCCCCARVRFQHETKAPRPTAASRIAKQVSCPTPSSWKRADRQHQDVQAKSKLSDCFEPQAGHRVVTSMTSIYLILWLYDTLTISLGRQSS